jgi:hypothetical protein
MLLQRNRIFCGVMEAGKKKALPPLYMRGEVLGFLIPVTFRFLSGG